MPKILESDAFWHAFLLKNSELNGYFSTKFTIFSHKILEFGAFAKNIC